MQKSSDFFGVLKEPIEPCARLSRCDSSTGQCEGVQYGVDTTDSPVLRNTAHIRTDPPRLGKQQSRPDNRLSLRGFRECLIVSIQRFLEESGLEVSILL